MARPAESFTNEDIDQYLWELAAKHPELKHEILKAVVADAKGEFIFARQQQENQS